jgi:LlaJI restriction endonuclease.
MALALPTFGIAEGASTGEWNGAVGFTLVEGALQVAFPKVYAAWRERLAANPGLRTRHLLLLVRVLAKYMRSMQPIMPVGDGTNLQRDPGMLDWLVAACELYEDFLDAGLYWVKRERLSTRTTSGTIAWSATIASGRAHLSDDVPMHLEVTRRARHRSPDDFLHRLHAHAVGEASILLTGKTPFPEGSRVSDAELAAIRVAPRATFLPLARTTYSDRGKRLLVLLQRYFQVAGAKESYSASGSLLFSADAFEFIWEHMLRVTINNLGTSPLRLAAARWHSNDGASTPGIAPKPDFGFRFEADGEKWLAIFDAKDKEIATTGRSGTEQDHYKQILYRLAGDFDAPVCNILLFPTLDLRERGPFSLLGSHGWDHRPATLVHEIAVDYPAVCSAYLSGGRLDPSPVLVTLTRR